MAPPFTIEKAMQEMVTDKNINIQDLSQSSKVLIMFMRTLLCPFNLRAIEEVNLLHKSLRKLNVKVVFVHSGIPSVAKMVMEKYAGDIPEKHVIMDSGSKFYESFGLGKWKARDRFLYHKCMIMKTFGKLNYNEEEQGKLVQLGGYFVVEQGKIISSCKQQSIFDVADFASMLIIPQEITWPKKRCLSTKFKFQESSTLEVREGYFRTVQEKEEKKQSQKRQQVPRQRGPVLTPEEAKSKVNNWTLDAVLDQNHLRAFFKVHCTKELAPENVLFFEDATLSFKPLLDTHKAAPSESTLEILGLELQALIQNYCHTGALRELNTTLEQFEMIQRVSGYNAETAKIDHVADIDFEQVEKALNEIVGQVRLNLQDSFARFKLSSDAIKAAQISAAC